MNRIHKLLTSFALLGLVAVAGGCSINYSFSGASIPVNAQTFSVLYFPNNAPMVAPTLSNTLTEALKERMMRQTKLNQMPEDGDLAFEGEITGYMTAPASVSAEEEAIRNRLTITVQVRFTNALDEKANISQSFSAYTEYDTAQEFQSIENSLIEEIVATLVDNIFNASVAQW